MLECLTSIDALVKQAKDEQVPADALSVLQIWDLISGTSDTRPYDPDLLAATVAALEQRFGRRPLRILDLGGGSGNPSVGLADYGHIVDLVDVDPAMCAAAVARSPKLRSNLRVFCQDWRNYLSAAQAANSQYDAILFLGNALAYQDSWPDRQLPSGCPEERIGSTLSACAQVLAPGGWICVESALEPSEQQIPRYVRFVATPISSETASMWCVEFDNAVQVRTVDTYIVKPPLADCAAVLGRVTFKGWLQTSDVLASAARRAGLDVDCDHPPFRHLFQVLMMRSH